MCNMCGCGSMTSSLNFYIPTTTCGGSNGRLFTLNFGGNTCLNNGAAYQQINRFPLFQSCFGQPFFNVCGGMNCGVGLPFFTF